MNLAVTSPFKAFFANLILWFSVAVSFFSFSLSGVASIYSDKEREKKKEEKKGKKKKEGTLVIVRLVSRNYFTSKISSMSSGN